MLREQFYIDLERERTAQPEQLVHSVDAAVFFEDKLISQFEPRRFPEHECRCVVRRRSLAELWALIAD